MDLYEQSLANLADSTDPELKHCNEADLLASVSAAWFINMSDQEFNADPESTAVRNDVYDFHAKGWAERSLQLLRHHGGLQYPGCQVACIKAQLALGAFWEVRGFQKKVDDRH